jgi:hypothetical protein
MEKKLILRGVLAGAIAGAIAFVFARIFAEPQIQKAADYETGRDAAREALDKAAGLALEAAHSDPFSRAVQANVGIGVGLILFGAALGLLFSVVYTVCLGRVGNVRPRPLAMLVALGGFLGLYFVPFLKYPANPPAIGHEDTIRQRTLLYLIMVVASIVLLVVAVTVGRRLSARFGHWNATLLALGGLVVALGIVMVVLPSFGELAANVREFGHHVSETPQPLLAPDGTIVYPGFPADTLFLFRLASVGAQVLLWTTMGLVFAPLAERVLAPALRPSPPPQSAVVA